MDICNTVKVKSWGKGQGDFVEINAEDFDEKKHELYEEKPDVEDASAEEIVEAIGKLDAKNDEHWTKGGLPDVGALAKLTGKRVLRAAVDAAAKDAKRPDQA